MPMDAIKITGLRMCSQLNEHLITLVKTNDKKFANEAIATIALIVKAYMKIADHDRSF